MKGVPVRLEIGPKDIENNQCVLVTRHNREKTVVSLDNLAEEVQKKLTEVHDGLYAKALENREKRTYACKTMDEIIIGSFHQRNEVYLNVDSRDN